MDFYFTNAAQKELDDLLYYTAKEWGKRQVFVYRDLLFDSLNKLGSNPTRGYNHPALNKDIKYILAGKHRIYFSIVENEIEILAIKHVRAEIHNRLFDD